MPSIVTCPPTAPPASSILACSSTASAPSTANSTWPVRRPTKVTVASRPPAKSDGTPKAPNATRPASLSMRGPRDRALASAGSSVTPDTRSRLGSKARVRLKPPRLVASAVTSTLSACPTGMVSTSGVIVNSTCPSPTPGRARSARQAAPWRAATAAKSRKSTAPLPSRSRAGLVVPQTPATCRVSNPVTRQSRSKSPARAGRSASTCGATRTWWLAERPHTSSAYIG